MQARANQAVYLPGGGGEPFRLKPRRVLTALAVMLLLGLSYWAVQRMSTPLNLPVEKIRVQGAFLHVTEQMLEPLSRQISGIGYFDLDIAAFQRRIEALPWIKHATVRRVWPDTVAIHFVEQQPLAIWAEQGILNQQGEIFQPPRSSYPPGLPRFAGPETARQQMMDSYQQFSQVLLPLGITIDELELDERRSWRVVLSEGLSLKLGRENELQRLLRFVRIYPRLKLIDRRDIKSVDLRYTNGMAVAWKRQDV